MTKDEKADFDKNLYKYKRRYYYRVFDIEFDALKEDQQSLQTSSILWDIHRIKISHQTVANYAASAGRVLKLLLDDYPYELSDQVSICGDETYIRVLGKKHYVFFIMDVVNKIITSYSIFVNRDGVSSIKAIYSTLSKFRKIPEKLLLVFDGNPIYILAQHFFAQHNIHFDFKQVIGLTNKDDVSKEYRWLKQIIERLNRTFKGVYKGKNGFNSFDRANEFMVVFTSFFNFHSKKYFPDA